MDGVEGITADQRKIKQVVVSLLDNALKFTPDGGSVRVSVRRVGISELGVGSSKATAFGGVESSDKEGIYSQLIAQRSELNGNFVEIAVEDTGIGISDEEQKRLFKSFGLLDSVYTKAYGGAGLGLYLTKKLVELHSGRIWVESEKGKGSKFVFIFPQECGLQCGIYRDKTSYKQL